MKQKYIKIIATFILLTLVVSLITSNVITITGISLMASRSGGVVAGSSSGGSSSGGSSSGGSSSGGSSSGGSKAPATPASAATTSAAGGTKSTTASSSGGNKATTAASGNNTPTDPSSGANGDADEPEDTTPAPVDNSAEYTQLLADYTAVVNKVKTDKPGYKNNDWQAISNVSMNGLLYTTLSTAAKSFLETQEQSAEGTHTKGDYPKWFAMPTNDTAPVGCVLTDTSKVESASSVTNADGTKTITITLIPEKDPVKDFDNPASVSSWHGQMFDVIDITQVVEYAKKIPGVDADNAYCNFHGTATLTYNPDTNECIKLDHVIDVGVFLGGEAKVIADYHFYDFVW